MRRGQIKKTSRHTVSSLITVGYILRSQLACRIAHLRSHVHLFLYLNSNVVHLLFLVCQVFKYFTGGLYFDRTVDGCQYVKWRDGVALGNDPGQTQTSVPTGWEGHMWMDANSTRTGLGEK